MTPWRGGPTGEAGAALTTAILFALVVMMVGHGILTLTRTQRWIAAADGARWVEDERRRAALALVAAAADSLPPGGTRPTPWGSVEVRELGPELRLLRARPGSASPGTGWATLLAAPDPVTRAGARSGAVRLGGVAFDAGSSSGAVAELCPPGLDGASAARIGPLEEGGDPRLGVLELEDLLSALPELAGSPWILPEDGPGACQHPQGFGDPGRPGSCPERWGAAARRGDLTLSGWGQGVLAVSGDLTLTRGARFRGWVWVGGSLRVSAGAELQGLADVGEDLHVEPTGAFTPDECAGARALQGVPALRVPRRVGPRAWPLLHR